MQTHTVIVGKASKPACKADFLLLFQILPCCLPWLPKSFSKPLVLNPMSSAMEVELFSSSPLLHFHKLIEILKLEGTRKSH